MPVKIISSQPYSLAAYLKKLAANAFLIRVLARRELKIKYANTFLGIGWFFLQPLLVVLVYSIFFRYLVKINSDNIPFAPFVFSGLVLWYLFTGMVGRGTFALVESADLINKVSFPRLIIVLSKAVPVLLECAILLLLLFIYLLFSPYGLGLNAVTALFYFLSISIFSFAIGLLCSAVAVRFRDIAHSIPIVINFAIWLTPVFYPLSIVPQPFQNYLRVINPLAGAIEGLRGALFFNAGITPGAVIIFACSCLFLLLAFYYFVKFEKKIVESL